MFSKKIIKLCLPVANMNAILSIHFFVLKNQDSRERMAGIYFLSNYWTSIGDIMPYVLPICYLLILVRLLCSIGQFGRSVENL